MRANEFISEMPLPSDWDEQVFSAPKKHTVKSFKERLSYALERAKKLGAGSARVAMTIEYQGRPTALKIAKNQKGLAQNEFEVDILKDGYYGRMEIVIPLIDFDHKNDQPIWLQTEVAEQANEAKLCQLLRCQELSQLVDVANYKIGKGGHLYDKHYISMVQQQLRIAKFSEEDIEIFMHYADELAILAQGDVILTDLDRAVNWGIYKGKPVVIDLGFSTSVHKQHYSE